MTVLAILLLESSCGGSPFAPPPFVSGDAKDLAEALLVGSGPLVHPFDPGRSRSAVRGWPAGSAIVVRVSAQLPQSAQGQIQQVVSRIPEATLGNVTATIQLTDVIDPRPDSGEITAWGTDDPVKAGCSGRATNCAFVAGGPFIYQARIVGKPGGDFPHEMAFERWLLEFRDQLDVHAVGIRSDCVLLE